MMTVSPATSHDVETLRAIAQACGMPREFSAENCLVAHDGECPVGFIRVEFVNEVPYIRPVAVLASERGKGIGKRLLEIVLAVYPEVRVVSRGTAAEVYRNLGFERMSWDEVHPSFRDECDQCPDKAECNPLPMIRPASNEAS